MLVSNIIFFPVNPTLSKNSQNLIFPILCTYCGTSKLHHLAYYIALSSSSKWFDSWRMNIWKALVQNSALDATTETDLANTKSSLTYFIGIQIRIIAIQILSDEFWYALHAYSLVQWIGYTFDAVWSKFDSIPHQKCIQFNGPNCRLAKNTDKSHLKYRQKTFILKLIGCKIVLRGLILMLSVKVCS